jgi:hypothetical protein
MKSNIFVNMLIDLLIDVLKIAGVIALILGGIWCVGWIVEVLSGLLSFETLFVAFLALVFYLIVRR